jgi:hypothetical protein
MATDIPLDEDDLPILNQIPREQWSEVLRPYRHVQRRIAVARLGDAWTPDARVMLTYLELEDPPPMEVRTGRVPAVPGPAPHGKRQVNMKLSPEHHERLSEAARGVGLAPTHLARLLVVRGVDEMLRQR